MQDRGAHDCSLVVLLFMPFGCSFLQFAHKLFAVNDEAVFRNLYFLLTNRKLNGNFRSLKP